MKKNSSILYNPEFTSEKLKEIIFNGQIIVFSNSEYSKALTKFTITFLRKNFNTENIKSFESKNSKEDFYKLTLNLKPILSNLLETKTLIKLILKEKNLNLDTNYFDLLRLRSITSYAHTIKEAKPAFAIHRDTWYANSESQINWWIPLFDVTELDMFSFYPEYFSKPVRNNSNEFDYNEWNSAGGFQSDTNNRFKIFPELKENIDLKNELKILCKAGDLLVFSASHLHGTTPNLTNETRFSLDFRTVDIEDINKNAAPNVDNYSKGSILQDMLSAKSFLKYSESIKI
jgi:hypothetical protein